MSDDTSARHAITALLRDESGREDLMDRLLPLVYGELRGMARSHLRGERDARTLDTTGLVHEAFLKLVDQTWASAESRAYFFGAASRAMRQILVDHARLRTRKKRGGRQRPVELEEHHLVVEELAADVLDLDRALLKLGDIQPRAARVEVPFLWRAQRRGNGGGAGRLRADGQTRLDHREDVAVPRNPRRARGGAMTERWHRGRPEDARPYSRCHRRGTDSPT